MGGFWRQGATIACAVYGHLTPHPPADFMRGLCVRDFVSVLRVRACLIERETSYACIHFPQVEHRPPCESFLHEIYVELRQRESAHLLWRQLGVCVCPSNGYG